MLEAAVGLMSHANNRYGSSKVTSSVTSIACQTRKLCSKSFRKEIKPKVIETASVCCSGKC